MEIDEKNHSPPKERKKCKLVAIIDAVLFNIGVLIVGIYNLIKKVFKFWWIVLIVSVLFFPSNLLSLLQGVVEFIEYIKNLFS